MTDRAPSTSRKEIAIAVVENEGSYLIGQRPPGVALAGCWEFPGGKVGPDETPAAAAVRECLEETSLTVVVDDRREYVEHDYAHGRLALHFFLCHPVGTPATPSPPFRWVLASELIAYQFPEANRNLVAALVAAAENSGSQSSE